jgi:hypothetical protein
MKFSDPRYFVKRGQLLDIWTNPDPRPAAPPRPTDRRTADRRPTFIFATCTIFIPLRIYMQHPPLLPPEDATKTAPPVPPTWDGVFQRGLLPPESKKVHHGARMFVKMADERMVVPNKTLGCFLLALSGVRSARTCAPARHTAPHSYGIEWAVIRKCHLPLCRGTSALLEGSLMASPTTSCALHLARRAHRIRTGRSPPQFSAPPPARPLPLLSSHHLPR